MKSLKRALDDKSDESHSKKYEVLVKDADQIVDEFQKMFSLKDEMANANEATIADLENVANGLFTGGPESEEPDSQLLTPEMKETLMQYLRTLKSQASNILDEHRKLYKTISKAIKDAEVNNADDYDHLHSPFIASAAALNITEDERMAMLDPLIADHLMKRSYTQALIQFDEESRCGCEETILPHFDDIKKLHDCLRSGQFEFIRRWLSKHEQYEKKESQNLHLSTLIGISDCSRDVTHRVVSMIDDLQYDDTTASNVDMATDVDTLKHGALLEGDDIHPPTEVLVMESSESSTVPQRYIGNQLLLSMGEKRSRLKYLLLKMEFIRALHSTCCAGKSDNIHSTSPVSDGSSFMLVDLACHLLKYKEHFNDEVQHLIGAMVLAQEPRTLHKTVYSDLACPTSVPTLSSLQNNSSETGEPWSSTIDFQKAAESEATAAETNVSPTEKSECHYPHSPSYEDAVVEASSLISELVCLMHDQPPHDSLDLLVHLGLSIMPQVYEKKDVVTFLAQKANADPQDYPVRVTNHEHAVHNVFHCPLKKDLFNAETDCVALTCGHVMSRAGFTGLKTNSRFARTLDGDRVICPYCPTHSAISRVRGVIF